MRIPIFILAAATSLGLGVAVVPAHAFDATGNWTGKWSCKGFDGTKFTSGNPVSTMAITQGVSTFGVAIDAAVPAFNFTYNAVAIPDGKKPNEKGEIALLGCSLGNTLPGGNLDLELVRASIKTKVGSPKASFKGTSFFADNVPELGTCKYSYKRIDTNDPGVGACPP